MTTADGKASDDRFEERIARLEAVLDELERGELSLEDSLKRYEDGVAELRRCYELLAAARARVERLTAKRDGTLETTPLGEAE